MMPVGVYDRVAGTLTLYVNGTRQGRIDGSATRTELTGDPSTRNTLANPAAVAPTLREVGITASSRLSFPPNSVTVLRVTGQ